MSHPTFEELLEQLVAVRDGDYRDDPSRNEARFLNMESVLQALLEKLRDTFDTHATKPSP